LKAEEIVSEKALAIMIYARTRPDKREKGREAWDRKRKWQNAILTAGRLGLALMALSALC